MKLWSRQRPDVTAKDMIVATTNRVPEFYYPKKQMIYLLILLRHTFPRVITWLGIPTL